MCPSVADIDRRRISELNRKRLRVFRTNRNIDLVRRRRGGRFILSHGHRDGVCAAVAHVFYGIRTSIGTFDRGVALVPLIHGIHAIRIRGRVLNGKGNRLFVVGLRKAFRRRNDRGGHGQLRNGHRLIDLVFACHIAEHFLAFSAAPISLSTRFEIGCRHFRVLGQIVDVPELRRQSHVAIGRNGITHLSAYLCRARIPAVKDVAFVGRGRDGGALALRHLTATRNRAAHCGIGDGSDGIGHDLFEACLDFHVCSIDGEPRCCREPIGKIHVSRFHVPLFEPVTAVGRCGKRYLLTIRSFGRN